MSFEIAVGCNVRKSPYFDATVADGVRSFSIYNHMYAPSHFGDPAGEYQALVTGVVLWDVSCERQVQLAGPDAERLARYLTTREIGGMAVGQGKYVPLCDHQGHLINDPVLQKLADDCFWLSIADSDILLWAQAIAAERGLDVQVTEPDASPLAVQGPRAEDVVAGLFGDWVRQLKYFWFRETELDGIPILLARSGWSKQGGFELYLRDARRGGDLYWRVKEAGAPYGIVSSAPSDIERVESGLLSYGADARPASILSRRAWAHSFTWTGPTILSARRRSGRSVRPACGDAAWDMSSAASESRASRTGEKCSWEPRSSAR